MVWRGDLPRPLQQILFDAADRITPSALALMGDRGRDVTERGVRYPLMRGLLRSRQPAVGMAIRAREPAAAAGWT